MHLGGVWAGGMSWAEGRSLHKRATLSQDSVVPVDQIEGRPGWQQQGEPGEGE